MSDEEFDKISDAWRQFRKAFEDAGMAAQLSFMKFHPSFHEFMDKAKHRISLGKTVTTGESK